MIKYKFITRDQLWGLQILKMWMKGSDCKPTSIILSLPFCLRQTSLKILNTHQWQYFMTIMLTWQILCLACRFTSAGTHIARRMGAVDLGIRKYWTNQESLRKKMVTGYSFQKGIINELSHIARKFSSPGDATWTSQWLAPPQSSWATSLNMWQNRIRLIWWLQCTLIFIQSMKLTYFYHLKYYSFLKALKLILLTHVF